MARSLKILQLVSELRARSFYVCVCVCVLIVRMWINEWNRVYLLFGLAQCANETRREEERHGVIVQARGFGPIVRRWIDGDVLMKYEYACVHMISF